MALPTFRLIHDVRFDTATGLFGYGAIVDVKIASPILDLTGAPDERKATLVVDTGASRTVLFPSVLEGLALPRGPSRSAKGVMMESQTMTTYRLRVTLQMEDDADNWFDVDVDLDEACVTKEPHGVTVCDGFLGRDFLAHFEFRYNSSGCSYSIIKHSQPPCEQGWEKAPPPSRIVSIREATQPPPQQLP